MSQAGRIGIYGASGSGKTTLARAMLASRPRVVVMSPIPGDYPGIRQVTTIEAVKRGIVAGNKAGRWKICYVPPAGREPEALHALSILLRNVQVATGRGRQITLAADELNLSFPVTSLPARLSGFGELCSRGRHYRIEMIGITQRLAEVNTRWRGNESERFIFRMSDDADYQKAARWLPDHRAALRKLRPFEYLHVAPATGSVTQRKTKR